MIETQTSNATDKSLSLKQDHGKTVLKKPVKKNDDIPFPYVYFGFIGCFMLFYGEKIWYAFPSYEEHMRSSFIPDIEQAHLPLFACFCVCPSLYFYRGFLKKNVFSYFAENWAGLTPGSLKHVKFCEQAWLALHYTISTSFAFYVLHDKPWFPPVISEAAQAAIMGTREEREEDQKDLGIMALYALQLGFYTLELVTLLRSGHRRSDFMVYFFHHIYTIYLMGISWISFNQRVGSLVLILHDVGDVFLPIGKCYTYAEEYIRKTKTKAQYEFHKAIGMGFFVMFVIAFAIPRLVLFGTMVFQGLTKYSGYKCCGYDLETKYCGECIFGAKGGKHDTPLLLVLGLLYPMHVYWFYLIAKMAIRLLLQPGKYDDVRSDDDEKND